MNGTYLLIHKNINNIFSLKDELIVKLNDVKNKAIRLVFKNKKTE